MSIKKNIIYEEYISSQQYDFEEVDFNGEKLVKLTRNNVALVEAMIRNDSAYRKTTDKMAGPKSGYNGSSAYWLAKLKQILIDKVEVEEGYDRVIQEVVEAIDRENSTHLNSDKVGREEITERIRNISREDLLNCLKDPHYKDGYLIRCISEKTHADKKPRMNLSFASKFCHFATFSLFENTDYQDNYSIYDSILKASIPKYLKYFKIDDTFDLNDYSQYQKAVDAIRQSSGTEISRNGFDHLIWYYHKARI